MFIEILMCMNWHDALMYKCKVMSLVQKNTCMHFHVNHNVLCLYEGIFPGNTHVHHAVVQVHTVT